MTHVLRIVLPAVVVDIIKEFTGEACWRRGKFIHIHRIPRNDFRYIMLQRRPKIKQLNYDPVGDLKAGCAWFKLPNNKFVVINVLKGRCWINDHYEEGDFWEMRYNGEKIICYV
jgi:hypothetical protein